MAPQRFQLWNGSWEDNWVIEDVQVVVLGVNHDCRALSDDMVSLVIATERGGASADFSSAARIRGRSCRDNRQIWWGTLDNEMHNLVLDPDHLFVQDIWINGWYTEQVSCARYSLNQEIGFVIKLRATKTTTEQAVLSLIKEQAQDTPE
jgi:hypothetical protein